MKNKIDTIFIDEVTGKPQEPWSPSEPWSPAKPLIIAELGTAHSGSLSKAKEMAQAAAEAGAACIKLQMVYADEILHPNTGEVSLPGGKIRLYDRFKQLEMPPEFYVEVKEYVESLGLLFLCTPFGLKSAKILHELQPKIVKIASPELNFTCLLQEIAQWNLPVLLSTGVSTLGDIEEAIEIIVGSREWGMGSGGRNSNNNIAPMTKLNSPNNETHSPLPTPQFVFYTASPLIPRQRQTIICGYCKASLQYLVFLLA
jgi:hypothetical protein